MTNAHEPDEGRNATSTSADVPPTEPEVESPLVPAPTKSSDDLPARTSPAHRQPATEKRPPAGAGRVRGGVRRSRFGALWVMLVLAAVVLILLLVFVLQNNRTVQISFLWLDGQLPLGVALLFAAIAGVLLVAIPGSARILQLRRTARRLDAQANKG